MEYFGQRSANFGRGVAECATTCRTPGSALVCSRAAHDPADPVTGAVAQFGQPGYETAFLLVACLVALVSGGS